MWFVFNLERLCLRFLRPLLLPHRWYFISFCVSLPISQTAIYTCQRNICTDSDCFLFDFVLKESEHTKIVERRAVQDAQTPEGLKSSPAVLEDSQLPLEQKKRKILRNLRTLEQGGVVTASNKYQDLINDISKVRKQLFTHIERCMCLMITC